MRIKHVKWNVFKCIHDLECLRSEMKRYLPYHFKFSDLPLLQWEVRAIKNKRRAESKAVLISVPNFVPISFPR